MLNTLIASTLFFAHWVCGAVCNDSTQTDTWFRQTVQLLPKPSSFHIAVACNVNYMVYVNERNISNAPLLLPGYYEFVVPADAVSTEIAIRTESENVTGKMPMVWFNVWGEGFSVLADETCQVPVVPFAHRNSGAITGEPWITPDKPQMRSISRYKTYEDEDSVLTYDFGRSINGYVRLTLRGAGKGEILKINDIPLKAEGRSDEQLSLPLTPRQSGIVVIESEVGEIRKKISNIEAIEIW